MLLALMTSLVIAAVPPAQGQAAVAPCRVSGIVVDPATRAGVAGAQVVVRAAQESTRPRMTTAAADAEGRFDVGGLDRGAYLLAALTTGFAESPPVRIELAGTPCVATIDVPYRLAMQTESHAEAPRLPEATTIGNAVVPTLSGAAIASAPGALEDVFRAFQAKPGVAASQDNRNDLLVRGGGAIENQTRIDGFDVPNPNHFGAQGGTGGGLSMIPPRLVDTAAIEAGGFSVAFGERISSVADISIRPVQPGGMHGMAGFGVGGAMGEVEAPFADGNGGWMASARRSLLELTFHEQGSQVVPSYADMLVKVTRRLGEKHTLSLEGVGATDSVVVDDVNGGSDQIRGTERVGMAGVRLDSVWSQDTSSTLVAAASTAELDAKSWSGAVVDGLDRGRDVEIRARGEVRRLHSPVGDLLAGAALKAYTFDYELLANGVWTPYSPAKQNISADSRHSFNDAATYLETTIPVSARGRITGGVRADWWGAPGVATASPRVKAEWLASRRARLVGYWGIYRQGIPYIWQASAPGNVGLAPISSKQYGGGVDLEVSSGVHAGIEGFDKRSRNYPVDVIAPSHVLVDATTDYESPFVGQLNSGGQVRARGVDTVVSARIRGGFQAAANYSYWLVSQMGLDNVWRRAELERRHQARVEMVYAPSAHWSAGLLWRDVTGQPYTPFDTKASLKAGRGVYDLTQTNALEYPPYRRLDVRSDRTFVRGRTQTVLYVEVDNLLNRDNVLLYKWNKTLKAQSPTYQWGRTYIGGLRLEF
jgi:hypothetical protein